jgi:hypothetical protein
VAISTTMPKMLRAQSTISQWKPRSAIAELPRDSRKVRIAEDLARMRLCRGCSLGAPARAEVALGDRISGTWAIT